MYRQRDICSRNILLFLKIVVFFSKDLGKFGCNATFAEKDAPWAFPFDGYQKTKRHLHIKKLVPKNERRKRIPSDNKNPKRKRLHP